MNPNSSSSSGVVYNPQQYATLQKQVSDLQGQLNSSKTALGDSSQTPTSYDLGTQSKLQTAQASLDAMESAKLKTEWYGDAAAKSANPNTNATQDQQAEGDSTKTSWLVGAMENLSKPLYAEVGAVKYALGKSNSSNLWDAMNQNMQDKEGYGNVLRDYGMNQAFTLPIGLALDIGGDPLNWLTAGEASTVGRGLMGAIKGGSEAGIAGAAEGAARGVSSKLIQNASTIGSMIPYFNKSATYSKLTQTALDALEAYHESIGSPGAVESMKALLQSNADRFRIGDYLYNFISQKIPNGQDFLDAFRYSPTSWLKITRMQDQLMQYLKSGNAEAQGYAPSAGELADIAESGQKIKLSSMFDGNGLDEVLNTLRNKAQMQGTMGSRSYVDYLGNQLDSILSDGQVAANAPGATFSTLNPEENAARMVEENQTDQQVREIIGELNNLHKTTTGVDWYDNAMKNVSQWTIKDVPVAAKVLNTYNDFLNLFKTSKVGMSLSSWMNMVMGNLSMFHMAGGDLVNPKFYSTLADTVKYQFTKDPDVARSFITRNFVNPIGDTGTNAWKDFIASHPQEMMALTGQDAKTIFTPGLMRYIQNTGLSGPDAEETLLTAQREMEAEMEKMIQQSQSPIERAQDIISKGDNQTVFPTDWASNETLESGKFNQLKKLAKEKAAENPVITNPWKAIDFALNHTMQNYGRTDQAYKLGTALHFTQNGMSDSELITIGKYLPSGIKPEDIASTYARNGKYYYRLTPDKAMEVANDIYINYNAMPAAVKILRSTPLLGAPFGSFTYGMANKSLKALANNPDFFNKINFLLSEASGEKTPFEKEALKSPYYSFLNDPGVLRLPDMPFFNSNPMYMNIANMVPYYSMNMFSSPNRSYSETLPNTIVNLLDRSPFMKDPIGQVLFDYIIQPAMLRNESVQSAFGSIAYPQDATPLQRIGYAMRELGEAVTPTSLGYLGLLTPSSMAQYMPSYRWRQLSEATADKNAYGIQSKAESTPGMILRALAGSTGLPVTPLETAFVASEVKSGALK